jgi:uncharacterized protein (TIGR03435 family)
MVKARVLSAVGIVAVAGSVAGVLAQTPASPVFEVASVKPNRSGDGRTMMQVQPGGRYVATNITVRLLIRNAYQLQDFQISGGPSWLGSDHFDITAKAGGDVSNPFATLPGSGPTPIQLMLRALLAERFKLVVHNDSRELPTYALVLARSDNQLGPKLVRSTVDCAAMAAARGRGDAPAPGPPSPDERPTCGMRIGFGNLSAGGVTVSQFANSLAMFVNRTVLDRTGLAGSFDVDLTWTPDQMPPRGAGSPPDQPVRVNGADIDPNGPSIFTAVQEQLGLKLESTKSPVDVLVIDSVERPTED